MKPSHGVDAEFDDPIRVSAAGLGSTLPLAESAGLHDLLETHLSVPSAKPANSIPSRNRARYRR